MSMKIMLKKVRNPFRKDKFLFARRFFDLRIQYTDPVDGKVRTVGGIFHSEIEDPAFISVALRSMADSIDNRGIVRAMLVKKTR